MFEGTGPRRLRHAPQQKRRSLGIPKRIMRRLARLILLVVLAPCQVKGQTPATALAAADSLDPVPTWHASGLTLLLHPRGFCGPDVPLPGSLQEVKLLAWRSSVRTAIDSVASALWWAKGTRPSGAPFWLLATAYQIRPIPRRSVPDLQLPPRPTVTLPHEVEDWQLTYICDGPGQPIRFYDSGPSVQDVPYNWLPSTSDRGGIPTLRRRTWQAALGQSLP